MAKGQMDVSQALIYTVIVPSRECNIELKLRLSTVDSRPFQVVYRSLDGPSGSSLITHNDGQGEIREGLWTSRVFLPEKGKRDTAPHHTTTRNTKSIREKEESSGTKDTRQRNNSWRVVVEEFWDGWDVAHWASDEHERRLLYKSLKCDRIAGEPSQKGVPFGSLRWGSYVIGGVQVRNNWAHM